MHGLLVLLFTVQWGHTFTAEVFADIATSQIDVWTDLTYERSNIFICRQKFPTPLRALINNNQKDPNAPKEGTNTGDGSTKPTGANILLAKKCCNYWNGNDVIWHSPN